MAWCEKAGGLSVVAKREYVRAMRERYRAAPVRAGVGTFSLSVGLLALQVIPVLGGLAGFLLALVALGAVRSTRFGGREPRSCEPAAASPQSG